MSEELLALSQEAECLLFGGVKRAGFAVSCVHGHGECFYLQHIQPSTASISKKCLQKQFSHDMVDVKWREEHQLHENIRSCGSLRT